MSIQHVITIIRRGQIIHLLAIAFFSLWLTGCGGLVTIVTATLAPTSVATVTQVAQVTESINTPVTNPSRTPRVTRTPKARATRTPKVTATDSTTQAGATALPATLDGLRVVTPDDLPPEAQDTLALIDQGGPFPYKQDGVVFQNHEGILPRQRSGYYHEYTVITPGSPDRGARRIITGSNGEFFYTDDHYATFVRVIRL